MSSDKLPEDVLARRGTLPLKPAAVTLDGAHVRLIPYDQARDAAALFAFCNGQPIALGGREVGEYDADALIWRWMSGGPFDTLDAFCAYMLPQVSAANGLPFTVIDKASEQPVGVANYINNDPNHLKIELGSIWYSPIVQRTPANTEATYLLLKHAFALGYRRAEWKCDSQNERSRHAALRMGFTFEGIQEAHMIIKGHNRDTAWFRILDHEWGAVDAHLRGLLKDGRPEGFEMHVPG
jgi:RimJ/RimL family protein N-acetyltransferase